ncbi:MAG: helix-turn-helix transcriptional regulator [Gemmatimonadetes bacterium]|nr:helix-turn-helix transcriptional regulator [Gemmatimonadota bacterium]
MPAARTDLCFHALGDGVRRTILDRLRAGELSAGEIAGGFDISWPAVSRHLRLLKEAGLVHERRAGRQRLYALNRATLQQTVGHWVALFDARWAGNLRSLKDYVERSQPPRGTP